MGEGEGAQRFSSGITHDFALIGKTHIGILGLVLLSKFTKGRECRKTHKYYFRSGKNTLQSEI